MGYPPVGVLQSKTLAYATLRMPHAKKERQSSIPRFVKKEVEQIPLMYKMNLLYLL